MWKSPKNQRTFTMLFLIFLQFLNTTPDIQTKIKHFLIIETQPPSVSKCPHEIRISLHGRTTYGIKTKEQSTASVIKTVICLKMRGKHTKSGTGDRKTIRREKTVKCARIRYEKREKLVNIVGESSVI